MTQNARQLPSRSLDCTVAGCTAAADKRLDLTYSFDKNANVAQIVDGIDGRQTRGMSYDGLDRLTQTTSNMFGTAGYSYDVLDNLTQVNVGGGSKARNHYYCYDTSWRLGNVKTGSCAGATVIGLGYDVQGNLANKNGTLYSFDYGNRLRSVGGTANTYTYDGLGRRVSDAVNGVAKRSQYTQGGQLVMVGDNRVGKVTEYFYLAGSLVAWRERNTTTNVYTTRYQHTDALGTPIAETDANKAFMNKYEYEPYGQQINGTAKDGPGYTGHVQDAATGMTYMQQRYMDPALGVFLSVDPVTAYSDPVGMFHRYRYANNNPYKFTDPDGRWPDLLDMLLGRQIESSEQRQEVDNAAAEIVDKETAGLRQAASKYEQIRQSGAEEIRERVSVNAKFKVSAGTGVQGTKNVAGKGSDSLGWVPVGEGAYAGLTIDIKLVSFDLFDGDSPFTFDVGGDAGAIGSIGGSASLDPAGKLDITVSLGLGLGEHTNYAPALNYEIKRGEP